ncbi:MAG: precorrin-6A [Beijerinckiaceae bacterium]|nr:MAG: precorrin-6A [Beijerinckiaceae bacterium]
MIELVLVGIGTGNPEHVTLQAIRALNRADLVFVPLKGADKADLAALRREILAETLTNPATRIVEFDLPTRNEAIPDYAARVADWHARIASLWAAEIRAALGGDGTVALLVWGDPSLYDSTLRIAAMMDLHVKVSVIPGITALQALSAAHAIPLNEIGTPFTVTTGRKLREGGWPAGVDTLAVMLDAGGAFEALDPAGITIWWGAYLGMKEEILLHGPLAGIRTTILETRSEARQRHGWIMDTYLLRRARVSN